MGAVGELPRGGVAGFDKGRWPVRLSANRAGYLPAPVMPDGAIARVPLSNPGAALKLSRLSAAPDPFAFRASRPALVRPEREPWRERRPGRRGGGASGPAGRLETV